MRFVATHYVPMELKVGLEDEIRGGYFVGSTSLRTDTMASSAVTRLKSGGVSDVTR